MDYEEKPLEKGDDEYIEEKIDEYDDSIASPAEDAPEDEDLVFKVEDEQGNIIAGCVAEIFNWSQVDIDILWVDERYRRQGLGSMLIREAERTAREKGCYLSLLGTFDFQARPLYEKHGYQVCGVVEDWPRGHANYSLTKRLDSDVPDYVPSNNSAQERFEIKRGSEEDAKVISEGLGAYNDSIVPPTHETIRLNKKLVNKDGELIAGIIAGVGGWDDGCIDKIWVEEPYRNQGLGSYLMREAEREAKENGAYMLLVEAHEWQLEFFKKHGFTVIGVYEDYPKGHCSYDLKKLL